MDLKVGREITTTLAGTLLAFDSLSFMVAHITCSLELLAKLSLSLKECLLAIRIHLFA